MSLPFSNNLLSIDEFEQTYTPIHSDAIAEGRNGRVYLYRHKKSGNQVAVQKIQNIDRQSKFYLFEEIRSVFTAAQKSPQILKIIDLSMSIIERKGALELYSIILIMEMGYSYQQMQRDTGKFTISALLTLFRRAAVALSSIHAAKLYHGNLKPQNIFQIEERQHWTSNSTQIEGKMLKRVKLSGFLVFKRGKQLPCAFTAPEIALNWHLKDTMSGQLLLAGDVYSLGIIILCMAIQKHRVLEDKLDAATLLDNLKVKVEQKEYTMELLALLKDMTDPEQGNRPTITKVLERIEIVKQKGLILDQADDENTVNTDSMQFKKIARNFKGDAIVRKARINIWIPFQLRKGRSYSVILKQLILTASFYHWHYCLDFEEIMVGVMQFRRQPWKQSSKKIN